MRTVWVAADGDDENSGEQDQPVATFVRANQLVSDRGTVAIMAGFYDQMLVPITGVSYNGLDSPVVSPQEYRYPFRPLYIADCERVTVDGIRFQHKASDLPQLYDKEICKITSSNVPTRNIAIKRCDFAGSDKAMFGILLSENVAHVLIEDCIIRDARGLIKRGAHGIYIAVSHVTVRNTVIDNCGGWGIHNWSQDHATRDSPPPSNNLYDRVTVKECGFLDEQRRAVAIGLYQGSNLVCRGARMERNLHDDIVVDYGAKYAQIS